MALEARVAWMTKCLTLKEEELLKISTVVKGFPDCARALQNLGQAPSAFNLPSKSPRPNRATRRPQSARSGGRALMTPGAPRMAAPSRPPSARARPPSARAMFVSNAHHSQDEGQNRLTRTLTPHPIIIPVPTHMKGQSVRLARAALAELLQGSQAEPGLGHPRAIDMLPHLKVQPPYTDRIPIRIRIRIHLKVRPSPIHTLTRACFPLASSCIEAIRSSS